MINNMTIPWESISMDFISALPMTKSGHDSILTVVDRLTKKAHFIPVTNNMDAAGVAKLLYAQLLRTHGLPRFIISDRDEV